MIKNHVRVITMMMSRKAITISIRSFLCFGIFHAMDDERLLAPVKKLTQDELRAHALFACDLRERIPLETNKSKREWLEKILTLHQQVYANLVISSPVVSSRSKSPIRISGESLENSIKKMVLVPSANSAFVSYQEFAKNSSDTSKS